MYKCTIHECKFYKNVFPHKSTCLPGIQNGTSLSDRSPTFQHSWSDLQPEFCQNPDQSMDIYGEMITKNQAESHNWLEFRSACPSVTEYYSTNYCKSLLGRRATEQCFVDFQWDVLTGTQAMVLRLIAAILLLNTYIFIFPSEKEQKYNIDSVVNRYLQKIMQWE